MNPLPNLSNTTTPHEFERRSEYEQMVATVATKRRNLLVFGEARSGKTRLLEQFAAEQLHAVYVSLAGSSLRDVLASLLHGTEARDKPTRKEATTSTLNMKGVLETRLAEKPWTLVLDHVEKPSAALGKLIKDLHAYGRTPLLFAGRSEHMEDIGNFRTFCTDKSSRLELKPWNSAMALAFAAQQAAGLKIAAANRDEVLQGIANFSEGYPGRMLDMLHMATQEKYRAGDQIKFRTVYLDYIMRGR